MTKIPTELDIIGEKKQLVSALWWKRRQLLYGLKGKHVIKQTNLMLA